ncbi:MAG: nucleoside-diphosphate kinase [Candidatus Aenigmarchaeota archaeon]|nr:nucleoside-diphosphate kinase [Candidatus Aenigmarchaeota archaeon]
MQPERTLVVIKPDGVQRSLAGKIISYYEGAGLKITAMKMLSVGRDFISRHYPSGREYLLSIGQKGVKAGEILDTEKKLLDYGMMIVRGMRDYMTSGPVVAMIIEGNDAIKRVRQITGYTDPAAAEKGTIRGDLGTDTIAKANAERRPVRNLIHASGNAEEARHEIALWAPEMK